MIDPDAENYAAAYCVPYEVVLKVWNAVPPHQKRAPRRCRNAIRMALSRWAEQDGVDPENLTGEKLIHWIGRWCRSPEGKGETKFPRGLPRWLDDNGWEEDPRTWWQREQR